MASKKKTTMKPTSKTVVNYGSFVVDIYYGEQVFRCLPNVRTAVPIDAVIPIGTTLREIVR